MDARPSLALCPSHKMRFAEDPMRFQIPANLLLGAVIAVALPVAQAAAQTKEPPSCSAITFRPIVAGAPDGEQDAGVYKSRFGRIAVKGNVKDGQAQGYFVTVNGNRPAQAANLPQSVSACAAEKKLPAPGRAADSCDGDR